MMPLKINGPWQKGYFQLCDDDACLAVAPDKYNQYIHTNKRDNDSDDDKIIDGYNHDIDDDEMVYGADGVDNNNDDNIDINIDVCSDLSHVLS